MSIKNWKICHLRFKAPLHLSKGKGTYDSSSDVLHSDTLKSAMFSELKKVLGDNLKDDFLNQFKISSAFPFIKKDEQMEYFIPRPLIWNIPINLSENEGNNQFKRLKNIAYISLVLFRQVFIEKKEIEVSAENFSEDGRFLSHQSFGLENSSKKMKVLYHQPTQHVQIPNDRSEQGNTFYVDQIRFEENAGLYFWLEMNNDNPQVLRKIKLALELLSYSGIGTDKNNGYGHFEFDESIDIISTNHFVGIEDAPFELALSLYCPKKLEVNDLEKSSYDLIKRGGFIASPENDRHLQIRKCSIYMFKEGSVFSKSNNDREGKIVDLKPNLFGNTPIGKNIPEVSHPIWRDGRALFLPIHLPTEL